MLWQAATTAERRTPVEDLIDGVVIHPDRLVVQVSGAPPFLDNLEEVGLRTAGTKPSVSEGGTCTFTPRAPWTGWFDIRAA